MARVNVPVTTLGFVRATLETALTGTHNDLTFTAVDAGPGGNEITVTYVVSGTNTPLSCTVRGKEITVNVATNGGGSATSTASNVKAKIEANTDAARLVTVALAPSNDGTGVVTALSSTPLVGGALGIEQPAQTASDEPNGHYLTGNDGTVVLEVFNDNASGQGVDFFLAPGVAKGQAISDAEQSVSIAAGDTVLLGPFPPALFNQNAAGDVHFYPYVSADLYFRAFKVARAT